jgi:hypothetical protein
MLPLNCDIFTVKQQKLQTKKALKHQVKMLVQHILFFLEKKNCKQRVAIWVQNCEIELG